MDVGGKPVKATFYILATGARPMPLPFEGNQHVITSDEFLELKELPERILFIGGGFISFEFAHFAARLNGLDSSNLVRCQRTQLSKLLSFSHNDATTNKCRAEPLLGGAQPANFLSM